MNTVICFNHLSFPFTFCFSWYTWKQILLLHTLVYIKSNLNKVSQLSLKLYEYLLSLLNLLTAHLLFFKHASKLLKKPGQLSYRRLTFRSNCLLLSYFNVGATLTLTEIKGKFSHNNQNCFFLRWSSNTLLTEMLKMCSCSVM